MSEIFKRFPSGTAVYDDILSTYIDTNHCNRLLSDYEAVYEQVYERVRQQVGYQDFTKNGALHTKLLQGSPSQRIKLLLSYTDSLQVMLSAANLLPAILEGLELGCVALKRKVQRELSLERWFGQRFGFHAAPYIMAAGTVQEVYHELLKETAVLTKVLASHLRSWYQPSEGSQRTVTLGFTGAKRFYHDADQGEECFYEICRTFSVLQQKMARWQYQQSGLNIQAADQAIAGNFSRALKQHEMALTETLSPLDLSIAEVALIQKQRSSFWKSQRYQAKLRFVRLDFERQLQVLNTQDFKAQWEVLQKTQGKITQALRQLHTVFHRKIRRQFTDYQATLTLQKIEIAREGMRQFFLDSLRGGREWPIEAWLNCLAPTLVLDWKRVYQGLAQLDNIEVDTWMMHFHRIAQAIGLTRTEDEKILTDLVRRHVIPVVSDKEQPAYPLLYAYARQEAYKVARPTFEDILEHLQRDAAWEDQNKAFDHLLFLILGDSTKMDPHLIQGYVQEYVERLAYYNLFVKPSGSSVWARLKGLTTQSVLLKKTKSLLSDLYELNLLGEAEREQPFLDGVLLNNMRIAYVRQMSPVECLAKIAYWGRLLQFANQAAVDTAHSYVTSSQDFVDGMANHLINLSKDSDIHAIPEFKQLIVSLHTQISLHVTVKRKVYEALEHWDDSVFLSSSAPSIIKPINIDGAKVFQKVSESLFQTVKTLTRIAARDVHTQDLLSACVGLQLTPEELGILASGTINASEVEKATLMLLLKRTANTPFASVLCQQQASLLAVIISEDSGQHQPDKMPVIARYLDVVSAQSRQQAGFFSSGIAEASFSSRLPDREMTFAN